MEKVNGNMQDGDKRITVTEALNRTGIPWGEQPGATSGPVQKIFGGEDEEFVELVVSKQRFRENTTVFPEFLRNTTVVVPEYTSDTDNMKEQTNICPLTGAVVVAVHRVWVGPTWQMRGVMMDANFHLFRFLVPENVIKIAGKPFEFSDWVPGTFIQVYHHRVLEMVAPQTTPVRPWMIILAYRETSPDPLQPTSVEDITKDYHLPASVENITKDYKGFIFHYSTINEVMTFGELWCQPHNWLGRDEVSGSFPSTEEYLRFYAKEMGEHNRPAVAVVTWKKDQPEYETRFVTRIDTWKNKVSLQRVYPVGCTCFSAFHCTECLAVEPALIPFDVSDLLDKSLKGKVESYANWYANNIPGATVGAAIPGCLRAGIIDQVSLHDQPLKDLQEEIKKQAKNENKCGGAMEPGGEAEE